VTGRDLDAAGITDPALRASYSACRRLNAVHGKTYYLSTLLLPPAKRPHVHALYAFARYADEIVDDLASPLSTAQRGAWLAALSDRFLTDLEAGRSTDLICAAVVHTARRFAIPSALFEAFLWSMRHDLEVCAYATYADLEDYMYGSAAVIGLQMLPILGPLTDAAAGPARALGEAFQLTNFIRDVGEDLLRGRLYLPLENLEKFGVTRADLERRVVSEPVRDLLRFEIERNRRLYRLAEEGIPMLEPTSRQCIRTALLLYSGILDEVERADYDVLTRRVRVPLRRRLAVAVPRYVSARRAWRVERSWRTATPPGLAAEDPL
jgi:15-cis-phytoene synthase